jgi:hypothetical protein
MNVSKTLDMLLNNVMGLFSYDKSTEVAKPFSASLIQFKDMHSNRSILFSIRWTSDIL